ncbi:hypothetical protein HFD91_03840 [Enterobacteriaceae bacterium EKM102V]|uniref:hypothetical protein n=1 Tax=Pantoea TaxID=53335 RepID=UPI00142D5B16|nr:MULTISPECIES: hypothetical protein [Pantoea]KAF6662707.1 hypothetical protein HFD91_03840 [Enterobacteriaceae bacterium EKM102V]KAF6671173.1 hypothetical protein HFD97_03845 [Pantoea sp. EKM103V]
MMDGIRSHGRTPASGHEEIALRSRTTASTGAAAGVDAAAANRLQEIARIEQVLKNESSSADGVHEHMQRVAVTLHDEMGQTADNVSDVLKHARDSDRRTSALAESAIGLAYGLSGVPGDLAGKLLAHQLNLEPGTKAHDFVTGLTAGLTAVAFKAVVSKLVDNSLKEGKWMQADENYLEPFMQEVMKRHDTLGHKTQQAALGGTGYNLRNPINAAISAGTQTLAENAPGAQPMSILKSAGKPAYLGSQMASMALTYGAGAASGVAQNRFDRLNNAEYLFGRTDWQERYNALASGQGHSAQGGRFDALMNNAKTPKTWGSAVRNLVALSQLVEGFALGGGLGLANMSKRGASEAMASSMAKGLGSIEEVMKNPANRAVRELAGQGAYIPVAAAAYFSQGAAAIAYDELKKAVKNKLGLNDEGNTGSSSSAVTDTTDGDAHTASGAGTPEGSPAPDGSAGASLHESMPASDADARAASPAGTPAPGERTGTATPSEAEVSDSGSVQSGYSGELRNSPPARSQQMHETGDTHAWWKEFPSTEAIKTDPKEHTEADKAALDALLNIETASMEERIEEMIPLSDALTSLSASSDAAGPAAGPAEPAAPAAAAAPAEAAEPKKPS